MGVINESMDGKVCIVTGANTGIGKATVEGLARAGAIVVMMCRRESTGRLALEDIRTKTGSDGLELIQVDLASFASIRAGVETFLAAHDRLDVLVNNAAVVPAKRETTEDGFEKQFGVNHLAPFLLTHLLLDRLKTSAPSRVVTVSSTMHQNASLNFDDLQAEQSYSGLRAYGESKLANILFTYELARRLEGTGITANCLHPGGVRTNLSRHAPLGLKVLFTLASPLLAGPKRGARTSVYLAAAAAAKEFTGKYFIKCRVARSNDKSHDKAIARRLWDLSVEMTGVDSA